MREAPTHTHTTVHMIKSFKTCNNNTIISWLPTTHASAYIPYMHILCPSQFLCLLHTIRLVDHFIPAKKEVKSFKYRINVQMIVREVQIVT